MKLILTSLMAFTLMSASSVALACKCGCDDKDKTACTEKSCGCKSNSCKGHKHKKGESCDAHEKVSGKTETKPADGMSM